jgi:VIT1/CCC1 family predicted Fe2+/Mn2+ transporter
MSASVTDADSQVRERLLQAWRGEIVAGRVYEIIADRMPAREAEILRRMAEAEGSHRRRLEARMTELGIPIPDPSSVRLSPWLRLQAKVAPVDRLLAAREAAEDDEVDDLYKRSTEVAAANVERERQEIAEHPEEEQEELSLFYQLKGIDEATADSMAAQLARRPDAMLRALSTEEFAVAGEHADPTQAAVAAGISTGLGAIVPVIPFIFTTGTVAIVTAAVISLIAHFLVGAAKSLVTLRSWWSAGLEMTLAGVIVGGATYLVGLALPT